MKILKYRVLTIVMMMVLTIGFTACHKNHDHSGEDGHNHEEEGEHAHEENESSAKSVHLNQAQFQNAEIDTGWFMQKNLSDVIYANGYTKLDPEDEADVNLPVSGTIKSVKVIEGDYVKKGQTLATMFSLDYNDMLFNKAKLQEELNTSEANLVFLEQEYKRQENLAANNINAQKVFQKISADYNTEKARIASVREQIQIMNQTLNLINSSGGSLIQVKAPISGYITDLNIKVGSVTTPGSPLFSIVDNSQMHVDLLVYEKDLNKVKVGQTVRFILTNQSNQEIKGEIYNIGKSFANDTKSVAIHADIEENDHNLIPGMYINALIDIGKNSVATLPEDAIVTAEGRTFVFIWESENDHSNHHDEQEEHAHDDGHEHDDDHEGEENEIVFSRLEVKTGARQLGFVEVTPLGEIHEGDKIVTSGAYYLQSHLQKSEGGGGHDH